MSEKQASSEIAQSRESENWNGSRSVPKHFTTLLDAMRLSRDEFKVVWARCDDHPNGKFHLYPGGRTEFWPDRGKE